MCVYHENKDHYIKALQTLSQEDQSSIMELLEKVLKKVQKEDSNMIFEENAENEFDNVKEQKMLKILDGLQNENSVLKSDLSNSYEEIKCLKKKNLELGEQIKTMFRNELSRLKETAQNHEGLEAQIKIKDSKIVDLQEKLENKIKTSANEISDLKVFDKC